MTNEYSFLGEHRKKDPFDNPTCKVTESSYFEYLLHCHEYGKTPPTESVLTLREDNIIPAICTVLRKPEEYGFTSAIVLHSSDDRLPGFVVCESMSQPPKHLFTKPKRALYSKARYYYSPDPDRVSEKGFKLISQLGLTSAIIYLISELGIRVHDQFHDNINTFSTWIELRPDYVKESWPVSKKPNW